MVPELISFETCPFVQRSLITLLHKNVEFDITYIDLENKPEWFLKISPFGKVPVLKVGDHVLFESAVINEYLDEIYPPSIHPPEPLEKAVNRAWIEFSSALNMDMFGWAMAKTEEDFKAKQEKMIENIAKLEAKLGDGPYFNGESFALVDTAFAPFFMRLAILEERHPAGILTAAPKCRKWGEALLSLEEVQNSVVPDLSEKFIQYMVNKETYMSSLLR